MKNLIVLFSIISFQLLAQTNITIVGDSHTVGPFGVNLHKMLTISADVNVALYGHSSSSALHWTSNKSYMLRGGVNHLLYFNNTLYRDPNPTHWRVRRSVPKFNEVLKDLVYDKEWRMKGLASPQIDVVVIALGANDIQSVSTMSGRIRTNAYELRKQAINKMIDEIESIGAKCLWIGPPNGSREFHTAQRHERLYEFLNDSIDGRCELMNSSNFKAVHCDKIHFNCKKAIPDAKKWAEQARDFILENIF